MHVLVSVHRAPFARILQPGSRGTRECVLINCIISKQIKSRGRLDFGARHLQQIPWRCQDVNTLVCARCTTRCQNKYKLSRRNFTFCKLSISFQSPGVRWWLQAGAQPSHFRRLKVQHGARITLHYFINLITKRYINFRRNLP